MSEYTALIAAIVFGGFVVFSVVGDATKNAAANMFKPATADFSAKFVKP